MKPQIPPRPTGLKDHNLIRQYYLTLKAVAIDLERENNRYFIIYHRNNNYWQFGGFSLLYYQHYLQKVYNLPEIHPRRDADFAERWPSGECAFVKDITAFSAQLAQKAQSKLIFEDVELLIFELPKAFSKADREHLASITANKEERFNRLVGVKHLDAVGHNQATQLHTLVKNRVAKFSAFEREYYGKAAMEGTYWIVANFVEMAMERYNEIRFYTQSIRKVDEFLGWLVTMRSLNMLELDFSIRAGELALSLKENLQARLNKTNNRNRTEKNG